MSEDLSIQASGGNRTIEAMKNVAESEQVELSAEQLTSKESFEASLKESEANPFASRLATKQKEVRTHSARVSRTKKTDETAEEASARKTKDSAEGFEKNNPGLKASILLILREQIKPDDTKEEILRKLAEFYHDPVYIDAALDFLLENAEGEEHKATLKEAKKEYSAIHARAIARGKNISAEVREAVGQGLGSAESTRQLYSNITDNPRDAPTLFEELASKYEFKNLKKIINFLLHCLGADMKSKGPSIPKGQLHRLYNETRSCQAILGVYKFFQGRMPLMQKMFAQNNLAVPTELNFELIAKQFMSLASERYPSPTRVLQTAGKLGIEGNIPAQIIVYTQMRDAVRQVAMNHIFKGVQHRDDLYMAIIETLEDLEEKMEDMAQPNEDRELTNDKTV